MADFEKLIADMRAGLEGVTPGPWKTSGWVGASVLAGVYVMLRSPKPHFSDDERRNTVAHVARCSPDNIAALLDEIDRLRKELAETLEEFEEVRFCAYPYCQGDG